MMNFFSKTKNQGEYYENSTQAWLPIKTVHNGIIALKQGRYVKILEITPVNFYLKSDVEQENIIYFFASYLKIAPPNVQIRINTERANIEDYLKRHEDFAEDEENEQTREMIYDEMHFVKGLSEKVAVKKRFFIVFSYEPKTFNAENVNYAEIERELSDYAYKAERYLSQCELTVTDISDDKTLIELLYSFINKESSKYIKPDILQEEFDEIYDLEEGIYENFEMDEKTSQPENEETGEEITNKETENKEGKKPSVIEQILNLFKGEKEEILPELWTGKTSVLDILAPSSVDNGSRDYIVVDGVYHSYLYIAGYGYRTKNEAAWLSPLVEAGDGIGISFNFYKIPREKILSRISQKTMLNRSRMRDVGDTRQDYEELDDAISAGFYLKEGINRSGQDFYYMSTLIEITASDEDELEEKVKDTMTLLSSVGMVSKRADFKHEQCFLSALPIGYLDADIERKARRNVLTDSLAASFPFSSFEIYDEGGIFLGLNKYNRSVAILDIFDSIKYANANGCIYGTTGAGKTFLLQNMALRFRMQGTQVFIIAPVKGHEYVDACEAIGGKYIKISPSSKDCINIMEIRKTSLMTDYEIKADARDDSILADKLQNLMIFFSLVKNDITQDELNLLDGAVIRTYKTFGITFDNKSLYDENGFFKKMPTLKDLYEELLSKEDTKKLALMIEKFAVGSLASFGRETNVDLTNKYIVLDMTEMTESLKPLGMFMALSFVWDKAKESRIQKKVIFLDELWTLMSAGENKLASSYVQEIFRLIRGFGGSAIAATQDLTSSFSERSGKLGKEILNLSSFKILLHLEEDEAFTAQKYLSLSDEETMQIIRFGRGEALVCANKNKVCVDIKASPRIFDLITTQRSDLEKRRKTN